MRSDMLQELGAEPVVNHASDPRPFSKLLDASGGLLEVLGRERGGPISRVARLFRVSLADIAGAHDDWIVWWPGISVDAAAAFLRGLPRWEVLRVLQCFSRRARGLRCRCGVLCESRLEDIPGNWFPLEMEVIGRRGPRALQMLCLSLGALSSPAFGLGLGPRKLVGKCALSLRSVLRRAGAAQASERPVHEGSGGADFAIGGFVEHGALRIQAAGAFAADGKDDGSSKSGDSSRSSEGSKRSSSKSSKRSSSSRSSSSKSKKSRLPDIDGGGGRGDGKGWRPSLAIGGERSQQLAVWRPQLVRAKSPEPRCIILIGMWPPSNQIIDQFRAVPSEPIIGLGMAPVDSLPFHDVVALALYPSFQPVNNDRWGMGDGPFKVDYRAVIRDIALYVEPLKPIAIVVFTRGGSGAAQARDCRMDVPRVDFKLEFRARNLLVDYCPPEIRESMSAKLEWVNALVARPFVMDKLQLYERSGSESNKCYFYRSDDPTVEMPDPTNGAEPPLSIFLDISRMRRRPFSEFPAKPLGGVSNGLTVIDPDIGPFEVRHHSLPWNRMVGLGSESGIVLGRSDGYAGSYVSEYVNYMTLKYRDNVARLGLGAACPYVGHVHVASDLLAARTLDQARQGVKGMLMGLVAQMRADQVL